jgi:putative ABC transport system ATP-binding protein
VTPTSGAHPVVELRDVGKVFDTEPPVVALDGVNLIVNPGDYVSVVGPSGSGKSTLLNIVGCLDRHSSGQFLLDGIDVATLKDGERAALRGQRIGFVFQTFHLLGHRTVEENVMLAELYRRGDRKGRRERAETALRKVGLDSRLGFKPNRLSGGERQRVAMARALVASPSLLLCDEPTGNLDSKNTEALLDLFDGLRAEGLTIIIITHDETVSRRAQRRVRIVDGILTEDDMSLAGTAHLLSQALTTSPPTGSSGTEGAW